MVKRKNSNDSTELVMPKPQGDGAESTSSDSGAFHRPNHGGNSDSNSASGGSSSNDGSPAEASNDRMSSNSRDSNGTARARESAISAQKAGATSKISFSPPTVLIALLCPECPRPSRNSNRRLSGKLIYFLLFIVFLHFKLGPKLHLWSP